MMTFQQQDCQIDILSSCFQLPKIYNSSIPLCESSGDSLTDIAAEDASNSHFKNSLESAVESFLSHNQCIKKYSSKLSRNNMTPYEYFPHEQNKLLDDDAASIRMLLPLPSERNQTAFPSNPCGTVSISSGSSASSGKKRIRWTKDLHEKFVMCVKDLGGPEKATPRAILKIMKSDVLTILHVKSHLQKYRTTMCMQQSVQERNGTDGAHQLHLKLNTQIKKALQLQLDVQRSLQEQLEIQQNLQLIIEEQKKQLNMMIDHQKKKRIKSSLISHTSEFSSQDDD
ncbi:Myb-like transcription factor family protein [Quillaja saponaria]|uniref:Myb-like transcription factor family protein n=1 Tax=Quillaja saponaria TaxID=32244 RepID=A0AAD7Q702_QUISA|nr:Myb-like transcription factor family protein [Quillaja saponaria]